MMLTDGPCRWSTPLDLIYTAPQFRGDTIFQPIFRKRAYGLAKASISMRSGPSRADSALSLVSLEMNPPDRLVASRGVIGG